MPHTSLPSLAFPQPFFLAFSLIPSLLTTQSSRTSLDEEFEINDEVHMAVTPAGHQDEYNLRMPFGKGVVHYRMYLNKTECRPLEEIPATHVMWRRRLNRKGKFCTLLTLFLHRMQLLERRNTSSTTYCCLRLHRITGVSKCQLPFR